MSADPDAATVTFRSSGAWTATVQSSASDGSKWISATPESGAGSDSEQHLQITALANPDPTVRNGSLILSSGDLHLEITITQAAAAPGPEPEPDPGYNQAELNAKLAVNRFTPFDVASLDEEKGTVEFCTALNCTSSAWFAWNEDWATKTYTSGGKRYRVPTALEMQLLMPGYDNDQHVYFLNPIENDLKEFLPEEIFGLPGGEGTSYFRSSGQKIEVGTDPAEAYGLYALRFMGTGQRSAYFYRWYNAGSETDAYLSIRIKAVPGDDTYTIEEIADNEAFWSEEYIEINIPACGMNFSGSILLPGASGDYWTSTGGGLDSTNPGRDGYAITLTFTDSYGYLGDSNKTNLLNLRMVEAE